MGTSRAVVVSVSGKSAIVKSEPPSSCSSCGEKHSCVEGKSQSGVVSKVANDIDAKVGDTVVLYYKSTDLFKTAFIIYIFPIVFLIIGAAIGDNYAKSLNLSNSTASVILAVVFFAIAILFVKLYDKKKAKEGKFSVHIESIVGQEENNNELNQCNRLSNTTQ